MNVNDYISYNGRFESIESWFADSNLYCPEHRALRSSVGQMNIQQADAVTFVILQFLFH